MAGSRGGLRLGQSLRIVAFTPAGSAVGILQRIEAQAAHKARPSGKRTATVLESQSSQVS
jgi:hypothetical protein